MEFMIHVTQFLTTVSWFIRRLECGERSQHGVLAARIKNRHPEQVLLRQLISTIGNVSEPL
jgi:hypothetical protein